MAGSPNLSKDSSSARLGLDIWEVPEDIPLERVIREVAEKQMNVVMFASVGLRLYKLARTFSKKQKRPDCYSQSQARNRRVMTTIGLTCLNDASICMSSMSVSAHCSALR